MNSSDIEAPLLSLVFLFFDLPRLPFLPNAARRPDGRRFEVSGADYYGTKAPTAWNGKTTLRREELCHVVADGAKREAGGGEGVGNVEKEGAGRGQDRRGCTHSELSAGLRIKTRGEFESGKVLNDFRRSCLASWFIRKSQFAQRAGRTSERASWGEMVGTARGQGRKRYGAGRERRLPVQPGKVLQNYDVAFLLS
ncbi:hypothetical protein KM043_011641 [Ampulex compressa]|nr:hypothetical protein KM043_011641 [Ampulex compressa]